LSLLAKIRHAYIAPLLNRAVCVGMIVALVGVLIVGFLALLPGSSGGPSKKLIAGATAEPRDSDAVKVLSGSKVYDSKNGRSQDKVTQSAASAIVLAGDEPGNGASDSKAQNTPQSSVPSTGSNQNPILITVELPGSVQLGVGLGLPGLERQERKEEKLIKKEQKSEERKAEKAEHKSPFSALSGVLTIE
jgi:hypothetical protein